MKKIILLFAIFFATILNGCIGKDGRDGKSFITFDWDFTVTSYIDNNPSIPLQIYSNEPYRTDDGIYTYDYTATDFFYDYHFYGTYTITINKGGKGGFLVDGDDGKDRNYLFYLSTDGLDIDVYENKMSNGGEKKFLEKKKITDENIQDISKIETRKFSKTFDNVIISVEEKVIKTKK